MAGTKSKRTTDLKEENLEDAKWKPQTSTRSASTRAAPLAPEEFINTLNSSVSNITSIFQLRDQLQSEVNALKEELSIEKEMKIERDKLEVIRREQEDFLYEFQMKKTRMERELKEETEKHEEKLAEQAEEQKINLKAEADAQTLKLKLEREEQVRTLKREREDWEREKAQFVAEKTAFGVKQKAFEEEQKTLREKLAQELNRDNAHAIEVLKLNHQKDIELLKGELKLEQAHRVKFESMLKEAGSQIEKLSDQLTVLSKEALASASTASVASKLKDIVSQLPMGQTTRVS